MLCLLTCCFSDVLSCWPFGSAAKSVLAEMHSATNRQVKWRIFVPNERKAGTTQVVQNSTPKVAGSKAQRSSLGEKTILGLGDLLRARTLLIIVRHMVDTSAYWVAPHQASIEGLEKVGHNAHVSHSGIQP